jgi:hypothetical protein
MDCFASLAMTAAEVSSTHFASPLHLPAAADPVQYARKLLDRIGLLQQLKTVAKSIKTVA